eukprot:CAMPEP_0174695696 /NCGR_PEP_ID=MMETSP1094-20130205/2021_1 /TAXON_ID=156173 /ORGANISM="Chrysochromulina brevifilum, Strain UTEX LB 985" /LENGTH=251 /DNA_ID=CAMNT_0015892265 /DNA_START=189 /DNA_END=945 /DNA_ORIENTATION=-
MGYSPTMCSSSREALFISGKFTTIILSAPLSTTLMLDRVNQERTHAEYLRHLYQTARKSKEEQKEGFKQLHAEMTQDLGAARSAKDQAEARHDELKHEMRLLEEKYQEETRKVRILQERMVDWKRKSGERMTPDHTPIAHCTPCSPSNPSSSALRQREPSPLHASLQSVPRCGLNATVHAASAAVLPLQLHIVRPSKHRALVAQASVRALAAAHRQASLVWLPPTSQWPRLQHPGNQLLRATSSVKDRSVL